MGILPLPIIMKSSTFPLLNTKLQQGSLELYIYDIRDRWQEKEVAEVPNILALKGILSAVEWPHHSILQLFSAQYKERQNVLVIHACALAAVPLVYNTGVIKKSVGVQCN